MKIECKTHGNVCWKLKRKFMDDIKMHFPQTHLCVFCIVLFLNFIKENALIIMKAGKNKRFAIPPFLSTTKSK